MCFGTLNFLNMFSGGLHKLHKGGGGLAKCLCYYISLCNKVAFGGGRGVKIWQNLAYVVYGSSLTIIGSTCPLCLFTFPIFAPLSSCKVLKKQLDREHPKTKLTSNEVGGV